MNKSPIRKHLMNRAAIRVALPILLACSALAPQTVAAAKDPSVDRQAACSGRLLLELFNGTIHTMDEDQPIVSSMSIDNGRIVAVGKKGRGRVGKKGRRGSRRAGTCRQRINLAGRTVIPGLIDSHVHFVRAGLAPGHDIRLAETASTIAELQQLIADRSTGVPADEFITVLGGISGSQFAEGRMPTLEELDAASGEDRPVYIQQGFAGPALTNSAGIKFFESEGLVVDKDGTFGAGPETIAAFGALKAQQTFDDAKRSTVDIMRFASSVGLTMVMDEGGVPFPGAGFFNPKKDYLPLLDLWRNEETTVRIRAQFVLYDGSDESAAVEDRLENAWYRFGDDMLRTTALGEHVVTFPTGGVVNSAYGSKVRAIAQHGWTHEQHSVSFPENEQHIQAIEDADNESSIEELRWSLAHVFEMGHEGDVEHIDRLKDMGMRLRVQGHGYSIPTDVFPLGRELGGENSGPLYRTLMDAGIGMGAGSDGSLVVPMNPWLSIYYMVTGKNNTGVVVNPGETLTRMEALRLYTTDNAWFSFDENNVGSLEVGKLGDIVVLSEDYLDIPEEDIRDLRSVLTIVGGQIVHHEPEAIDLH